MIIRFGLLLLSIGIVLLSLSSVSITHQYQENISFSKSYVLNVNPLMIDPRLTLSYNGTAEVRISHEGESLNLSTPLCIPLDKGKYCLYTLEESSQVKFVNATLPPSKCDNSSARVVPVKFTGNITGKLEFSGVRTTLYGEQWSILGITLMTLGLVMEVFTFLKGRINL